MSVSLPLREEPFVDRVARPFFSGLLPDEGARRRLAAALGISSANAFGLLEVIGGECAGALSLVPPGQLPPASTTDNAEALDEQNLEEILSLLRQRPLLGGEADVRLSLAGAQDKLAVTVINDQILLPRGGRPTTHILKPFIEGLGGTVESAWRTRSDWKPTHCWKRCPKRHLPSDPEDSPENHRHQMRPGAKGAGETEPVNTFKGGATYLGQSFPKA